LGEWWNSIEAIPKGKGIQVTSFARPRAFVDRVDLALAMPADREEYLPQLQHFTRAGFGTDAALTDSSADCPRSEMIFEHLAPPCYPCGPSSVLLEQSASAGWSLDELPAEDMHRAVLNISEVYAEICETAERIFASPPRQRGHGKKAQAKRAQAKRAQAKRAYGKIADGMSAGG
jgi:hypothetical protein